MWQNIIVALVIVLAAAYVGRALWRKFRPKPGQAACDCGGSGPCHTGGEMPETMPGACRNCAQAPPQTGKDIFGK